MIKEIYQWAEEGRRHGIPWCCGIRFGLDCAHPKLWSRLGKGGIRLLHLRDALVPGPRMSFAQWDGRGYVPCEYHLMKWALTGRSLKIVQDPVYIDQIAAKARAVYLAKMWKQDGRVSGRYGPPAWAEFIESLRGEDGTSSAEEAAYILFILLSMFKERGLLASDVLEALDKKCDELLIELRGGTT